MMVGVDGGGVVAEVGHVRGAVVVGEAGVAGEAGVEGVGVRLALAEVVGGHVGVLGGGDDLPGQVGEAVGDLGGGGGGLGAVVLGGGGVREVGRAALRERGLG